jgi:hypothetical protein
MSQTGPIDDLLMKDSLWVAVYHSFSKDPTVAKVIRGPRKSDDSPKYK